MGLYRSSGIYCTQCEAEGFRRITYFLDRPDVLAVYTTRIEARSRRGAGAARQRQPGRERHARRRRTGTTPSGTIRIPKPSYLFALVGGRPRPRSHDASPPRRAARSSSRIYVRARQGGPLPPGPWTRSSAPCAGTRSASGANTTSTCSTSSPCPTSTWARWRTRASTSSTTSYVLASPETATDADYANIEARHRARVLPQLDRQPHHLPRLVPALPQGRPDGLPRPGVLRRRALAPGAAHRRRADAAGAPVPRGCRPARPSGAADAYSEINNFYTATVYEKGAEIVRMLKTLLGDDGFRARHGPLFRAPRRQGRDGRGFPRLLRRRDRPRPRAVHALVRAGRHAARSACAGSYDAAARTYRLDFAQETPPTPGQPAKEPMAHPGRARPRRAATAAPLEPRASGQVSTDGVFVLDTRAPTASPSRTSPRRRCRRCCAASRRR